MHLKKVVTIQFRWHLTTYIRFLTVKHIQAWNSVNLNNMIWLRLKPYKGTVIRVPKLWGIVGILFMAPFADYNGQSSCYVLGWIPYFHSKSYKQSSTYFRRLSKVARDLWTWEPVISWSIQTIGPASTYLWRMSTAFAWSVKTKRTDRSG